MGCSNKIINHKLFLSDSQIKSGNSFSATIQCARRVIRPLLCGVDLFRCTSLTNSPKISPLSKKVKLTDSSLTTGAELTPLFTNKSLVGKCPYVAAEPHL